MVENKIIINDKTPLIQPSAESINMILIRNRNLLILRSYVSLKIKLENHLTLFICS
jgi:hypothetical protein